MLLFISYFIIIDVQACGQLVHCLGMSALIKVVIEVTGLLYIQAEGREACLGT